MQKNVIITGASGNLGKVTVEKFISEGYRVIATVSPGKGLGYEVSGDITIKEVDLTNESSVADFVSQTINEFKTIDAALLLVGAFAVGNISNTDAASIQKMMSLNFYTAYHAARPIFSQMINQQSGRIILVGSRPAIKPSDAKNSLAYAFSKSLIFRLAEVLNAEGAKKNVVTHVIVPSTMDTPANRKALPNANPSDWVRPEDVAEAMAYLCSEKGLPVRESILKIYSNS